jgi:hypothetical protein
MYKRDAFPMGKDEFPDHWLPMEAATKIRSEWKRPARPLWTLILRILNPWQASRLYRQFERRLPACHPYNNWNEFIQGMRDLTAAMQSRSKKYLS